MRKQKEKIKVKVNYHNLHDLGKFINLLEDGWKYDSYLEFTNLIFEVILWK